MNKSTRIAGKPHHHVTIMASVALLLSLAAISGVPTFADSKPLLGKLEIRGSSRGLMVLLGADKEFGLDIGTLANGVDNSVLVMRSKNTIYGLKDLGYKSFPLECPAKSIVVKDNASEETVELFVKFKGSLGEKPKARKKGNMWLVLVSSKPHRDFIWSAEEAVRRKTPARAQVASPPKTPPPAQKKATTVAAVKSPKHALLEDVRVVQRDRIEELILKFDGPVRCSGKRVKDVLMLAFRNGRCGIEEKKLELEGAAAFGKMDVETVTRAGTEWLRLSLSPGKGETGQSVVFPQGNQIIVSSMRETDPGIVTWSATSGEGVSHRFVSSSGSGKERELIKGKVETASKTELTKDRTFALHERSEAAPRKAQPKAQEPEPTPPKEAPKAREETVPPPKTAQEPAKKEAGRPPEQVPVPKPSTPPPPPPAPPADVEEQAPARLVVVKDNVNLRSEPSSASKQTVVGKLPLGTIGTRIAEKGVWHRIRTAQAEGWVHGSLVVDSSQVTDGVWERIRAKQSAPVSQEQDVVASLQRNAPATPAAAQVPGEPEQAPADAGRKTASAPVPPPPGAAAVKYIRGGRDPFIQLTSKAKGREGLLDMATAQLVGVLYDESERVALLEDKQNERIAFALRENDPVLNGKLLRIQRDAAVFLVTEFGFSRTVTLGLKKTGGEAPESAKGPAGVGSSPPGQTPPYPYGQPPGYPGSQPRVPQPPKQGTPPPSGGAAPWTTQLPAINQGNQ